MPIYSGLLAPLGLNTGLGTLQCYQCLEWRYTNLGSITYFTISFSAIGYIALIFKIIEILISKFHFLAIGELVSVLILKMESEY